MPMEITWSGGRTRGSVTPLRGRVVARSVPVQGQKSLERFRELVNPILAQSAERLAAQIAAAYPKEGRVTPYHKVLQSGVFVGFRVKSRTFFWHEWDTRPHWPPFGKNSEIARWAAAHGMSKKAPFYIARKMAPIEATGAFVGGHKMTVGGLGGVPSARTQGRLVATRGKYAATDALREESTIVVNAIIEVVGQIMREL